MLRHANLSNTLAGSHKLHPAVIDMLFASQPRPLSLHDSPLHGVGVRAEISFEKDDVVLMESPLHFLQTMPNRKHCILCATCLRPLGNMSVQLGVLQGLLSRENIHTDHAEYPPLPEEHRVQHASQIVPCTTGCGELYCCVECRDRHWTAKGHRLLCTGSISEDEAADHPLICFKVHAITTNEIFLMVAEVFASMCCQADTLISTGMSAHKALHTCIQPLSGYVRELWWKAAVPPKGSKPIAFRNSLKSLVSESWSLLNDALQLQAKGYSAVLSEEYMSRTIGMFEQNNVGVQLKNSVASYVEGILSGQLGEACRDAATSSHLLEATNRILDSIDDNEMCCEDDLDDDDDFDDDDQITSCTDVPIGDPDMSGSLKELVEFHGLEVLYPPVDGTAFFSTICRINHSCDPNVRVVYRVSPLFGMQAHLTAIKTISAGEELVQSYIDQFLPYADRQQALEDYGFKCSCVKCSYECS